MRKNYNTTLSSSLSLWAAPLFRWASRRVAQCTFERTRVYCIHFKSHFALHLLTYQHVAVALSLSLSLYLTFSHVSNQGKARMGPAPLLLRRNSYTPLSTHDQVKRPRLYSAGNRPWLPLVPSPSALHFPNTPEGALLQSQVSVWGCLAVVGVLTNPVTLIPDPSYLLFMSHTTLGLLPVPVPVPVPAVLWCRLC